MLLRKRSQTTLKYLASSVMLLSTLTITPSFAKQVNGAESGDFDYYVFAQTWLPEFCSLSGNKTKDSCTATATDTPRLTIHGLWPNYSQSGSYPAKCVNSPGCKDSNDSKASCRVVLGKLDSIQAKLDQYMPGGEGFLFDHEWRKHGTCSGLEQLPYFQEALELEQKMLKKLKDSSIAGKNSTTLGTLQHTFTRATFICKKDNGKYYLSEIRSYWNKDDKHEPSTQRAVPSGEHSSCGTNTNQEVLLRSFSSDWLY